MVINHLLTGMILQVGLKAGFFGYQDVALAFPLAFWKPKLDPFMSQVP